jgi:hypothetical protein
MDRQFEGDADHEGECGVVMTPVPACGLAPSRMNRRALAHSVRSEPSSSNWSSVSSAEMVAYGLASNPPHLPMR